LRKFHASDRPARKLLKDGRKARSLHRQTKEDNMKTTIILALAATLAGGPTLVPAIAATPETLPGKETETLVAALAAEPSLTTFTRLMKVTGLAESLRQGGPYTILAPDDGAFRMVPKDDMEQLLDPGNREALIQTLSYHILPESIPLASVSTEEYVTLQGSRLILNREGNTVWAGRAEVMKRDINGGNGNVIHTLNMVLEPDHQ
jgi:uncharacterized surface protein with fasciclin (FAS1) repeats